jgi:hypothetical protein
VLTSGVAASGIERALWMLTAYREDGITGTGDTAWMVDEFRNLGTTGDIDAYLASIGDLIGALMQISSTFLEGWGRAQGTDGATMLAIVRKLNDRELGDWGG